MEILSNHGHANNLGFCEIFFTQESSLSLDQNELEKIRIYPNPVKEYLYIETLTSSQKYVIYDISGRKIYEGIRPSALEKV